MKNVAAQCTTQPNTAEQRNTPWQDVHAIACQKEIAIVAAPVFEAGEVSLCQVEFHIEHFFLRPV